MPDEKPPEGQGTGKGESQSMTLDQFLEKNPDLKKRLDAGDAAVSQLAEAEVEAARKRGDVEKLLTDEQKAREKERLRAESAEAKLKTYERREKNAQHVDAQKDLKVPAKAVRDLMDLLDDGKMSTEDLFKKAVERVTGWGVTAATTETDALESGGSGAATEGAKGEAAELNKLVELGVKAMKTNKAQDKMAYNNLRVKLEAAGVKIGPDVARRIAAGSGV